MRLLILGAGQYGHVALDVATSTEKFSKIDFLDDNNEKAIGILNKLADFKGKYDCCTVAIGNNELRETFLKNAEDIGYDLSPLISPHAFISPSATIEKGAIIEPFAVVNANAVVGKGSYVSACSVINHNAVVGEYCHIDCGTIVTARAIVSPKTKTPCGAVINKEH